MTEVEKFKNNKEIIAYLAEKFPLCFSIEGEAKPLKIGLFQELAEALAEDERVSKTLLRQVLRQYTSSWRYLHCCKLGATRVDLYGQPCGVLEQEHADHAAAQLAESKARFAAKKASEKPTERKVEGKNTEQNKNKKRKNYSDTRTTTKAKNPTAKNPAARKAKPALKTLAVDNLVAGLQVRVRVAEQAKKARILEVAKDNVRVELENGLILSVTADRLVSL